MGAAAERIALAIETTADLTGVRQAEAATGALSADVQRASNAAVEAEQKWTQAVASRDTALRDAARAAGTDMVQIQKNVAGVVEREKELEKAAAAAAAELERQRRIFAQTGSRQLGPAGPGPERIGPQLGPALPDLTTAAAAAASAKVAIDKIPGSARSAASGLGMLTQAAMSGTGSMAGMANAAGSVAFGISALSSSAKVAASAAGIGAIITVAVLAAEALASMNKEAKTSQAVLDHIGNLSTRVLSGAHAELAALDARIEMLTAKAKKAADTDLGGASRIQGTDAQRAQQELDVALALRETLFKKVTELDRTNRDESRDRALASIAAEAGAQQTAVSRYAARLRQIEAERANNANTRALTEEAANARAVGQRRDLERESHEYVLGLEAEAAANEIQLDLDVYTQRRAAADRTWRVEKLALDQRTLLTDDYARALDAINQKHELATTLIAQEADAAERAARDTAMSTSDDPREQMNAQLGMIAAEQAADEKRMSREAAGLVAAEKRRLLQKRTIDEGLAGYGKLSAAVINHGTVVGAVAKAAADAISLYEIAKKGKSAAISAKMEWSAAMAAFGRYDALGGALHLAAAGGYAAAALAAGAEAAGVVSGGGGASSSGGSGAGSENGTFQPREAQGGGAQIINLYTVNPYSRENMGRVSYELSRNGTLKRPIQLPPTLGLTGAMA